MSHIVCNLDKYRSVRIHRTCRLHKKSPPLYKLTAEDFFNVIDKWKSFYFLETT